ncbi:MAG: hypothetical protein BWY74_02819 [Firmicutes bacterium ADurb.Bin419]|nr:MAG: hypothetical protein BWY74_02819 [Firmicutes bacterium ADurb.Bin419]
MPTGGSNNELFVNAGNNATITLPAPITLSGSASNGNGATLKTTWSLLSGPSKNNLDIIKPEALNTTALVTFPGTYAFRLSVTDGVKTSSSTVTISANQPVVTNPPSWINSFYKKCIVVNGIPICATGEVPDQALINSAYVMDAQLRKIKLTKPAILQKMVERRAYTIIVGLNETNSMHPSWAGYNDSSWPRRGGGGNPTTILEEDCIVPSNDGWRRNFCGQVHEFAHTLLTFGIGDAGMSGAEPETYNSILKAYNNAIAANKYTESDYDRGNYHEYFTGQSGRWFNANPTNLNVPNAATKTDREQLKEYDPEIYNILESLYGDYELPEPWN